MPQKGQITKHEWKRPRHTEYWLRVCPYCNTRRVSGTNGYIYKVNGHSNDISFLEPKCITRKKPEDGNNIK